MEETQKRLREISFEKKTDHLFAKFNAKNFEAQNETDPTLKATMLAQVEVYKQEWIAKKEEIRNQYPY